jgi:hypothetical protein
LAYRVTAPGENGADNEDAGPEGSNFETSKEDQFVTEGFDDGE